VLDGLEVKGRAPKTGYAREEFGQAWADVDHNGCDTRNDILARELAGVTYKPGTRDCVVATGTLADPCTATTTAGPAWGWTVRWCGRRQHRVIQGALCGRACPGGEVGGVVASRWRAWVVMTGAGGRGLGIAVSTRTPRSPAPQDRSRPGGRAPLLRAFFDRGRGQGQVAARTPARAAAARTRPSTTRFGEKMARLTRCV
jgi:hypothetical protein